MHTYSVINSQPVDLLQPPKKFQIIFLGLVLHAAINGSFLWVTRGVA